MSKKRKQPAEEVPITACWLCEGCGEIAEGESPPDECQWCAHRYFESLADLLSERAMLGYGSCT